MQSIILHIDMNSYFASVEQQDHPQWRGRPVGVCEHLGGIIIGASIEAKRWGIGTGTPVWEARKIFPKIILTKTHPDRYRFYTARFLKLFSSYTNDIDKYSIDEAFLDVTRICNVSKTYRTSLYKPTPESSSGQALTLPIKITPSLPGRKMGTPIKGKEYCRGPVDTCGAAVLSSSDEEESRRQTGRWYDFDKKDKGKVMVDPWSEAIQVALEIKRRMKTEVGDWLSCSVGVASNKLLAKIASELQKPDGLSVVLPDNKDHEDSSEDCRCSIHQACSPVVQATSVETDPWQSPALLRSSYIIHTSYLYAKLKLTDIPGIGKRQERRLNNLGIYSLIDLRDYPESKLITHFGILGHHLHNMGQLEGSWKERFQEDSIKSIGHMYTLPLKYRNQDVSIPVIYKLSEMVAKRLRDQGLMGNVISFFVHDKDYEGFGKSRKLDFYLYDGKDIFLQCLNIFNSFPKLPTIKLIGITVSSLEPLVLQQSLFGDEELKQRLNAAMDEVNEKYQDFMVSRGWILKVGDVIHDSVGFGRMKEFG